MCCCSVGDSSSSGCSQSFFLSNQIGISPRQDFAQDAQVARLLQSWGRICILHGSHLQESGDSDHRWMQRHL
ncbi:BnaC06g18380D [Brassica napus]|uniref:BnaC06g18380D protein n=1 Tax=Brassica napus TaxID=3708 RepID=A0A078GIB0_BRANA|nr:BnaC06g18380D [Brassica napus]